MNHTEIHQVATYCSALNSLIDTHSTLTDPRVLEAYPKEQHDTFIKYHSDCISNLMPQLREQVRILTKLILTDHHIRESPAMSIMTITSPKIAVINNTPRDNREDDWNNAGVKDESLSQPDNDWEITNNGSNI